MMPFFGLRFGVVGVACVMVVGMAASPAWGQCTPAPSGLVSWWDADGDAIDIVDANHGILVDGATFAPGEVGQAFSFDGVLARLVVPASSNLDITGDVTVELWAKRASASPLQFLVSKGAIFVGGVDAPSAYVMFFGANNEIIALFERADGSNAQIVGPQIIDNAFHHYAYVRHANSHELYVDAAVVAAGTFTGAPGSTVGLELHVGAVRNESSALRFFNGLIDELGIYNRALSPSEIEDIFNAGSAGKCKDLDGDGVNDADDACPDSDLNPTIVIGGDDTGVENELLADGCSLADLVAEVLGNDPTTAAIVQMLVELKAAGLLSGQEMGAILKSLNNP